MSETQENHDDAHVHESTADFICPNDGKINRDDVIFLCNTCTQADMTYKNGIYMCPSCLTSGENFECMICDSKKVEMKLKEKA